ncbi:NADH-ubiquinone oxidoreductase-F iron-sulfur binding region domain-containing protein [Aquihabitans sp. McL0605]|uniref:NADH-ubiquinone oxidoreductase-F iron-sulfur binding region domain-containing protein n=1 Tax=Aquihabitans sp. McL0605 TaxID=3415671 RepID=UPI003CEEC22C
MPRRVLDAHPVRALEDWMAAEGGRGVARAWESKPDDLIATISASGLRGRGGAGFPTGTKWATVRANHAADLPSTVVVNGAEGEPGSYKDRSILLANPYRVIEGALIAAAAVGADQVVLALKSSAPDVVARVRQAIEEMGAAGWFQRVAVDVVVGPEHYLYGEETALLEVIDGREPFPRIAPPWRRGLADVGDDTALAARVELAGDDGATEVPPALVNNVETIANVPGIIVNGPAWFREVGTDESPGTLVVTVSGGSARAGVAELPMGITMRDAIDLVGGGARTGKVVGVLPGVSSPIVTAADLDVPLTYEDLARLGSGMGAGALMVIDEDVDPIALAQGVSRFLAVESCGQCRPCKQDGIEIASILERALSSAPAGRDRTELDSRLASITVGARCSLATQHQTVVGSILAAFPGAWERHAEAGAAPATPVQIAEIARIDDDEAVLDAGQATKQPDWSHHDTDSGAAPADRIDQRADAQMGLAAEDAVER